VKRLDMVGEGADVVIANDLSRPKREQPWQKDLRHGKFRSALDRVLDPTSKDYSPLTVLTALVALRHRSALRDALEGRDEISVQPILKWVQRYIIDPRYVPICADVAMHLLDLYAEFADESAELAAAFRILYRRVKLEVEGAQKAIQTSGMLTGLLIGSD
jgi:U3 small nucleolar RNA-associated protein 15